MKSQNPSKSVVQTTYPTYKDSKSPWLGKIPEHWEERRFRDIFGFSKGLNITKENLQPEGIYCVNYGEIHSKYPFELDPKKHPLKCVDEEYLKVGKKSLLNMGDFVFADTSEDIEGSGNFTYLNSQETTFAGYHTVIARPKKPEHSRFLAYVFDCITYRTQIRKKVKGVKVYSITNAILKDTAIWFPPLKEQKAIAEFLDRKTQQIDRAIALKKQQIALLQEQKQIRIQQAVTRGLDSNATLKDSGLDWIGDIPAHWEVKKLKYLVKIRYGLGQPPKELHNGLPIIRATNIERGLIVENGMLYVDPEDLPMERKPLLEKDDIIVVRSGAYTGDSARIGEAWNGAVTGYDMVLSPFDIESEFLAYSLLSNYILYSQLYLLRMRAAQPHLNAEELGETLVVVPPIKDQKEIIHNIQKLSIRLTQTIVLHQTQIQKLKEYKSTLIDSVVTGKLRVLADD